MNHQRLFYVRCLKDLLSVRILTKKTFFNSIIIFFFLRYAQSTGVTDRFSPPPLIYQIASSISLSVDIVQCILHRDVDLTLTSERIHLFFFLFCLSIYHLRNPSLSTKI
jgi:hypothetical protein